MKKTIILLVSLLCGLTTWAQTCTITAQFDGFEQSDITAKLVNLNTRMTLDTVAIEGNVFHFTTDASTPFVGKIVSSTRHSVYIIVEPGTIYCNLETDSVSGTHLNDRLGQWNKEKQQKSDVIYAKYEQIDQLPPDSSDEITRIQQEISDLNQQVKLWMISSFKENNQNYLGVIIFERLSQYYLDFAEATELLQDASTQVTEFPKVKSRLQVLEQRDATSVGKTYTDLDLTDFKTGKKVKLSQYIKGKIALIDFWASWCRPCREEIPNIASIYKKYGKKIVVISLNVWDKPDPQAKAIKDMKMDWIQLTDDTRNSTNTYGIQGIPHIMLVGADGTILSRDLRGENIEEAVIDALK